MRKILVVSDSPALRETVDIVLADRFAVQTIAAAAAPARLDDDIALLIVDPEAPIPAGEAPIISIGDSRFRSIPAGRRRQYLPSSFDPLALREAADMLARTATRAEQRTAPAILSPPYLTPGLAQLAQSAAGSRLPACIWGEAGTGKLRVARALHGERGAQYLHVVSASQANGALRLPEDAPAGADVTVVLVGLDELEPTGQHRLLDLIETGVLTGTDGRAATASVIALSRLDPTQLVREQRLDAELFYRLGVFQLPLAPLRLRPDDVPDLARAVAASLCERLGRPAVTFTEASLGRLSRYLWFGNLAELEAVVARSIVFAARPEIDLGDLRFGYGSAPEARPAATAAARLDGNAAAEDGEAVDLIIQELAHEFKNPMVTIKTFAHQLDHMLSNGGGHEEFARLTGEAVERMDAALENLIQYTRFEEPARQPTSLGSIVSHALGGVQELIAEKQLALEVEPTTAQVWIDPAQGTYAVKNLLRAVVRELSQNDPLSLRANGRSALRIEYPARARSAASSLSRLVSGESNGKDSLSLGFAFAKALIERNDGRLELDRDGDVARVTVEFPLVGDGKGEHGEAQGSGG